MTTPHNPPSFSANLTDEQKLRLLAEIDGRTFPYGLQLYQRHEPEYRLQWWSCDSHGSSARRERYLDSYDAIIPLWQKVFNSMKPLGLGQGILNAKSSLLKTPTQLADALLAARQKEKE